MWLLFAAVVAVMTAAFGSTDVTARSRGGADVLVRGRLSTVWIEQRNRTESREFYIFADDGTTTRIVGSQHSGDVDAWTALDRRRVVAIGTASRSDDASDGQLTMVARELRLQHLQMDAKQAAIVSECRT